MPGFSFTMPSDPTQDDPAVKFYTKAGPGKDLPEPAKPAPSQAGAKLARLEAAETASQNDPKSQEPNDAVEPCPLKETRHALEAQVLDEKQQPLENIEVELRKSDTEALLAKSDAEGRVRFDKLAQGGYKLGLRGVDRDSWEILGDEDLPAERDTCTGDAAWNPPASADTAVKEHKVQQGECVATLAEKHGFLPEALWNADENAALRAKRENLNILAPDDVLKIPAPRPGFQEVQTSKSYRLGRKGSTQSVKIRFLGKDAAPRAEESYLLSITSAAGCEERTGKTDSSGFLAEIVPATTTELKVTMGSKPNLDTYTFKTAHLDPIDSLSGVQGRLTNLGYYCGDKRGELNGYTKRALRDFQRDNKLPICGEVDDATRAAIARQYQA